MATFRVGQRVRVVRAYGPRKLTLGKQATVIGALREGIDVDGSKYFGYPIEVDGVGRLNEYGVQTIAGPYDIEPIQDDGRTVITWDACCWKPPQEVHADAT